MDYDTLKKLEYISPFINNDLPITIMGLTSITEIFYLANKKKDLCRIFDLDETDLIRKYRQENARIEILDLFQFALYTTASYCKDKFSQYLIDANFVFSQAKHRTTYRMLESVLQASLNVQSKADTVTMFGDEISMNYLLASGKLSLQSTRAFALETLEIPGKFDFKVYSGVKP